MSEPNPSTAAPPRPLLPLAVGWIAFVLLLGYTLVLHQGLGYPPGGFPSKWWHPTQFLLLNPTVAGWADVTWRGVTIGVVPAVLLTLLVLLGTRSAVAKALAVTALLCSVMFVWVGLYNEGPWEGFHWRASVVMMLLALCVSVAATAPALAASLLRRGPILQALLYLPAAFVVVATVRNATGTDETLPLNFSPWPAVAIFGLEVGAYVIAGVLLGIAAGVGGLATRKPIWIGLGLLGAVVLPVLWFGARASVEANAGIGLALVTLVALGGAAITRGGNRSALLAHRALHFGLAALLVALPLLAGRAWADADYTVNKFVRAQVIIDALQAHYDKEGGYPAQLEALVEKGYLEELPRPRVGFGVVYAAGISQPIEFTYRELGSSYVLEFVSTQWVQCAYNPPWQPDAEYEDEYEDEEYEDEYGDEADDEVWSCPETRPELF